MKITAEFAAKVAHALRLIQRTDLDPSTLEAARVILNTAMRLGMTEVQAEVQS